MSFTLWGCSSGNEPSFKELLEQNKNSNVMEQSLTCDASLQDAQTPTTSPAISCGNFSTNHSLQLRHADLSSSGRFLVTTSYDKSVQVFDLFSHSVFQTFESEKEPLFARISHDHSKILIAYDDNRVEIRNLKTQELLATIQHEERVKEAIFSPSDEFVASAAQDGKTHIYNLTSEKIVKTMTDDVPTDAMFMSSDGQQLFLGSNNGLKIFEFDTNRSYRKKIELTSIKSISQLTLSPNNRYLVALNSYGFGEVYDVQTQKLVFALQHHDKKLPPSFNATGDKLASIQKDGKVKIYDLLNKENETIIEFPGVAIQSVQFHPTKNLTLTLCSDGKARTYDVEKRAIQALIDHEKSDIQWAFFTQGGTHVVSVSLNGRVDMSSVESPFSRVVLREPHNGMKVLTTRDLPLQIQNEITVLNFNADGSQLLVAGDGTVHIVDMKTKQVVTSFPHYKFVWNYGSISFWGFIKDSFAALTLYDWPDTVAEFDADKYFSFTPPYYTKGEHSVAGDILYDTEGQFVGKVYSEGVYDAHFVSDGRELLTRACFGGTCAIRLFNIANKKEIYQETVNDNGVQKMKELLGNRNPEVSSNPKFLMTQVGDYTVKVFDLESKRVVSIIEHAPSPHGYGLKINLSPDGRYLVTGGRDGVVKLTELTRGEEQ